MAKKFPNIGIRISIEGLSQKNDEHKYIKYPAKWALQNKLRSMQGKPICIEPKWCDVGQDPCQGDLREKF